MFGCSVFRCGEGFILRITCGNCRSQDMKDCSGMTARKHSFTVSPAGHIVTYVNCKRCGRRYNITVYAHGVEIQDFDIAGDDTLGP